MRKLNVKASVETIAINNDPVFLKRKIGVDLLSAIARLMLENNLIQFEEKLEFIEHIQHTTYKASGYFLEPEKYSELFEKFERLNAVLSDQKALDLLSEIIEICQVKHRKKDQNKVDHDQKQGS